MRDYSVSFGGRLAHHPEPKKSNKGIALVVVFLLILGYITFTKWNKTSNDRIEQKEVLSSQIATSTIAVTDSHDFISSVKKIIDGGGGTYSVYIYNLHTKQEWAINEETIYTAASVNKVAILAAVYHLAGTGDIDLEKNITLQQNDIQDYGAGSIRYDPVGTTYSVKTLARLMMEKSDNTAAHILGTMIVTPEKNQSLIDSWGLTQTSMVNNKSSAKDMQILMTKMYNNEITPPQLTKEMLGFMDQSDYDDRLPAGLPDGVKIYHKTGDDVGKLHDVGIVDLAGKPYYIGVFTTDMTDEGETKKKIAEISKLTYQFMK